VSQPVPADPHTGDPSIGPLVPADETLLHQAVDTFASVGTTDVNWTEKLWLQACTRDGEVQASFGLGKYANRNVLDCFAGVSRGTAQWTVRASRALHTDREHMGAGPIRYEIVEPLSAVRIVLEPSDVQPIAFDLTVTGVVPPRMEDRELHRDPHAARVINDVVRYHQTGVADGWIEVDGTRHEIRGDESAGTRDHSWGVRMQVGAPLPDLEPPVRSRNPQSFTSWAPWLMERDDGSRYALFHYFMESNLPGAPARRLRGGVEAPDGSELPFTDVRMEIGIDDVTRRFLGGVMHFTTADGAARPVTVTPVQQGTGFHLGTGLYFGLDGQRHGMWRGDLHVDGDHFTECDTLAVARQIHQHRDCVVVVDDPVGGGRGWGSIQTIAIGGFPAYGTTLEATFI
jgi:hypothetical protein